MNCEIICSSKTGNTSLLANEIQKKVNCDIHDLTNAIAQDEFLFIGFWVNKGSCNEEMEAYLKGIHHKKLALFGTMGTGDNDAYTQLVRDNIKKCVSEDNEILGIYLCQGKMPAATRVRYESMLANDPRNVHMQMMLQNFDSALTHPDTQDISNFNQFIDEILNKF